MASLLVGATAVSATTVLVATSRPAQAAACSPSSSSAVVAGVTRTISTFTSGSACTWVLPSGVVGNVEVLVSGAGGGGGYDRGGGGGGGGLYYSSGLAIAAGTTLTVTVGTGGAGKSGTCAVAGTGNAGTSSVLSWPTKSITAAGGTSGGFGNGIDYGAGSGDPGIGGSVTLSGVVATTSATGKNGGRGAWGNYGGNTGEYDLNGRPGTTGTSVTFAGTARIHGSSGGGGGWHGSGGAGGTNAGNGGGGVGGAATTGFGGGGGGGQACQASGSGGDGLVALSYVVFQVDSFTTATSSPTNSTAFTYTLTFSSAVDATTVANGDVTNAGTAGCSFVTSPTVGTATVFTVAVTGCVEGTLIPTLGSNSVTTSTGTVGPSTSSAGTTVTIDLTAPAVPGVPDLSAASDSGSSTTDNITSDSTPTMSSSGGAAGDTTTVTATKDGTSLTCTFTHPSTSCELPALTDGTWTVSATRTDSVGNTSAASAGLPITIDTSAPAAPEAPDLVAASDSGSSSTDNVTSDTTPAMSLSSATSGDTVQFTATSGATTKTCSYTVPTASSCDLPTLTDGTWSVTARVTDAAGNQSSAGSALSMTIDTSAPAAPGAPDLAAASDTGTSSTDNITSDTTPTMTGSGGSNGDTMTFTASNGVTSVSCSYVLPATSCDLPALTDGDWTVSGKLTDPAGNQSAAGSSLSLTVDGTAPALGSGPDLAAASDSGTSSTDDITSDSTPTVSLGGGSNGDRVTLTATSGATSLSCSYVLPTTSCDLPALTDGTWSLSGALSDTAGNTASHGTPILLTIDTSAPAAPEAPDLVAASDSGSSSTDNVTSDTTPAMSLSSATSGDTVQFTATSGATTKTCSYTVPTASSCDLPTLTDGTWSVTARVTDAAGNQSSAGSALSMTIDTSAPAAPGAPDLAAASDTGTSSTDNITSDTTPTMTGSGGSNGDTMTFTASNGVTSVSCSYVLPATSCDLPALTDGDWTVSATLRDPAGNQSTAGPTLSMTVDGSGPASPGAPDLAASSDSGTSSTDDVTSDSTPTMSVSGAGNGDRVTLTATNGTTSLSCNYTVPAASSCDLPALTDGTWSVSGAISDTAGNTSAAGTPLSLVIDSAAPSVTSVDLESTSDSGTSSTDNVTNDTTPTVSVPGQSVGDRVTVTASNGSTTATCTFTVSVAVTSCDLSALTDGTWSLTAVITDPAGNVGTTTSPLSLTVDTTAPAAPGQPDLAAASDTGTSTVDDVTNDTTPTVSAAGGGTGDTLTLTATNGSTTRTCSYVLPAASCDLPALTDGSWSVTAALTDPAGNVSPASSPTVLTVDTDGPVMPTRPDLAASSDTGVSSTDDVTADTTPLVNIPGVEAGASVTVSATKGGRTVSCTYTASPTTSGCVLPELADGTWTVSAVATDTSGNTTRTTRSLLLTIDSSKPFENIVNNNSTATTTTTTPPMTTAPGRGTTGTTSPRNTTAPPRGTGTVTTTPRANNSTRTTVARSSTTSTTTTTTTVPPSPLGTPDLRTQSDTGTNAGDDMTNERRPVVGLDGLSPGDSVSVYATKGDATVTCTYVVGKADGCALEGLEDGNWTVNAAVVDLAGNKGRAPGQLSLTVDSTPSVSKLSARAIDDPSDGTSFIEVAGAATGETVVVTAVKAGLTVTCTYVVSDGTNGCPLEGIEPGSWTVTAGTVDGAGNAGPPSTPFAVSYERPVPADNGGGNGAGAPADLPNEDAIRLLASALALLTLRRRRTDDDSPERLSSDERDTSGVAEYSAGSGSGGLDVRDDLWVPPNIPRLDDGLCRSAERAAPLSPVIARSLDDGSYLRALFGAAWPVVPVTAVVLGVLSAADSGFEAVLPSLGLFVTVMVLGTFDALAGLLAATAYGTALLLGGGLDSADAVRGLLGIAGPMFLVGLVASAMRPFRRAGGEHLAWNRAVDFVLIPLIGAWTAGAMFSAVPFLSGFDVEWSGRVGTVELAALVALVVRFGLENLARVATATRLARIENEELPEPGDTQKSVSRIVRTAVFAFVAVVFIGANWWLVAGTLMFLVPKLIEHRTEGFPNSGALHRWLPRNLVRIVSMLLVMLWWGLLVDGAFTVHTVQWAFVLMSVPGLALGIVDWFAREGGEWRSTPLSRVLGVATLVLGVVLVRGWWP